MSSGAAVAVSVVCGLLNLAAVAVTVLNIRREQPVLKPPNNQPIVRVVSPERLAQAVAAAAAAAAAQAGDPSALELSKAQKDSDSIAQAPSAPSVSQPIPIAHSGIFHSSRRNSADSGKMTPSGAIVFERMSKKQARNLVAVIQNRMILVGLFVNFFSLVDPSGLRKGLFSVGQWYALVVFQQWIIYSILSYYFYSWLYFLLRVEYNDKETLKRLQKAGLMISMVLNTFVSVYFVVGVNSTSKYHFCTDSYILYISFWMISSCVFMLVATITSIQTILKLKKTSRVQKKDKDIRRIFRRTISFDLVNLFVIIVASTAINVRIWEQVCSLVIDSTWYLYFLQVVSSLSWIDLVVFNWIWNRTVIVSRGHSRAVSRDTSKRDHSHSSKEYAPSPKEIAARLQTLS